MRESAALPQPVPIRISAAQGNALCVSRLFSFVKKIWSKSEIMGDRLIFFTSVEITEQRRVFVEIHRQTLPIVFSHRPGRWLTRHGSLLLLRSIKRPAHACGPPHATFSVLLPARTIYMCTPKIIDQIRSEWGHYEAGRNTFGGWIRGAR